MGIFLARFGQNPASSLGEQLLTTDDVRQIRVLGCIGGKVLNKHVDLLKRLSL